MSVQTDIDRMLTAYIECALWSTNDDSDEQGGEPLDANYGREDLAPETLEGMRADCLAFYAAHSEQIAQWDGNGDADEQAGHDLWLTRNGHGAGFWDRSDSKGRGGWPNEGKDLTEAAQAMGEVWLYVGDDGQIYSS